MNPSRENALKLAYGLLLVDLIDAAHEMLNPPLLSISSLTRRRFPCSRTLQAGGIAARGAKASRSPQEPPTHRESRRYALFKRFASKVAVLLSWRSRLAALSITAPGTIDIGCPRCLTVLAFHHLDHCSDLSSQSSKLFRSSATDSSFSSFPHPCRLVNAGLSSPAISSASPPSPFSLPGIRGGPPIRDDPTIRRHHLHSHNPMR